MNNQDTFPIEASSDLDYEKMVVNIHFGLEQVAILSCDRKIVYGYSPAALVTATLYRDDKSLYCYRQECDLRGKLIENGLFNCAIRYRWDKDGRLTSLTSPHFSEEYRYDLVGNMVAKSGADPKGAYESQFAYDDLYQLIEESGPFIHRYGYDSLFNRRKIDGEEVAVDALNQVTSNQGMAYQYDDIGRRIAQGDRRYRYDALGRLLAISDPMATSPLPTIPLGGGSPKQTKMVSRPISTKAMRK